MLKWLTSRGVLAVTATAWFGAVCASVSAAPVTSTVPVSGPDDVSAVATPAYAGGYAAADSFEDRVEFFNALGTQVASITTPQMLALAPWMTLDGGPDGPSALCASASGRLYFALVHDDTIPGDGLGSDAILRHDASSGLTSLFARLDAFDRGDVPSLLAMAHHKAVLYAGTQNSGIRVYLANASATTGTLLTTWTLPSAGLVRGIAIDRDASVLFAATQTGVFRATIPASFATAPTWTQIVTGASDIRALAWGDQFGASAQRGLYILNGAGGGARVDFVAYASAYSATPVTPSVYHTSPAPLFDLVATADGGLLGGADEDAVLIRDDSDTRLSYTQWLADEFTQVTNFARGLISPDGEPPGWVIDADTEPALPRFHPATPDGAGWTLLLLLMSDHLTGDPLAQAQVRSVLLRYAGLAGDGIAPSRTADGIYRHWIDPLTGQTKPGWDPEFATLSTMKIVVAAARAAAYYPDDPLIVRAAHRIIFRVKNHDAYIQSGTDATAFKGLLVGGADTGTFARPFHEGIIFAEQCAKYGSTYSQNAYARWLNRSLWPTASFVPGMPITSTASGLFESAFISLYPALLISQYRADSAWQAQVNNIRWSNGAWTDDNGPRFLTVFSAGTTRSDWGGYRADSLASGGHPGNVTTFTSLMALSALGDPSPAISAYHAYRKGGRQTFRTGASILYRRSDVDRSYLPNSAGLPDVALGALALSDFIQPGSIDAVLARPYPTIEQCPVDLNADGVVDIEDLYRHVQSVTDLNGDGVANVADTRCLRAWCRRSEPSDTTGR